MSLIIGKYGSPDGYRIARQTSPLPHRRTWLLSGRKFLFHSLRDQDDIKDEFVYDRKPKSILDLSRSCWVLGPMADARQRPRNM